MQITGPSPISAPSSTSATVVFGLDLDAGQVVIVYAIATTGARKTIRHAAPAALLTAIKNHIQTSIETIEGWMAGSSTLA